MQTYIFLMLLNNYAYLIHFIKINRYSSYIFIRHILTKLSCKKLTLHSFVVLPSNKIRSNKLNLKQKLFSLIVPA